MGRRSTPSVGGGLTNLQQVLPVFWLPASAVVSLPIRACFGACAVSKTEILVSVSFKNIKRRVLNRRGNCDNFNEAALLQVLAEKDSDMMRNPRPEVIHRLADNEVCGDKPRPLFLCISVKGSSSFVVFIICICETGGQKKAKIDQQSAEVGLGHEHKNLVGKPYECY